jgi:importin-5
MRLDANFIRQNPSVLAKAPQCFKFVAEALHAETLQGQTAERTITASKQLVAMANMNADQLLAGMAPEVQQTVRRYFG